jgi:hypothetical protein
MDINHRFMLGIQRMKMWRGMVSPEHLYDYPIKHADGWHNIFVIESTLTLKPV